MSAKTRLFAYLFLPLLLAISSFLAMSSIGDNVANSTLALGVMLSISLLLGLIPILLYRFFVHSQLLPGFACMHDGRVLLPNELEIAEVIGGDRINYWQAFDQSLSTTVRLHGTTADLLVNIHLKMTLWQDECGKELAVHIDEVLPLLEERIQESLYKASQMDDGFAAALDGSILLNEEDERVLKSKFLSALETLAIDGIYFPHEASGIHVDRNVKKIMHPTKSADASGELFDEADLLLDDALLKSAGIA